MNTARSAPSTASSYLIAAVIWVSFIAFGHVWIGLILACAFWTWTSLLRPKAKQIPIALNPHQSDELEPGGRKAGVSGFCEQCGAALGEAARFCAACGARSAATPPPQAPAPPKRKSNRRWPAVVLGVVGLLIIIAVAEGQSNTNSGASLGATNATAPLNTASSTPPPPSKPAMPQNEKDARDWINRLGSDANKVTANLAVVQIQVGLAKQNPTVSSVNTLAQYAQRAHDNLDGIRQDFAFTNEDSGSLGNAELAAFSGANDLKNSMGALVAYTGTPNAATLASFTTQYQKARGEWNYGVRTIWRLAHRRHPPAV